jgi:hypothetical protein
LERQFGSINAYIYISSSIRDIAEYLRRTRLTIRGYVKEIYPIKHT